MFGRHHRARGAQGCGPAQAEFTRGRFGHHMGGQHLRRPKYNVPLNIEDAKTEFILHVYATGFSKENIKLSVQDDVLFISGTRTLSEGYDPDFSRQEFPIKTFERVLNLNGQVDTANISAKQEDGVLIVTLPKTVEASKPAQEIPVN
ncbi:Hsp20/alpha crystallin family protein [Mucilaginibacter sp. HMF5004]|uniref:Hsp20/alpha crystallin family protein n=1 Tax=Mucilaginibacter rivuli TaxID=2857527 RepID=UPI001C5D27A5|nr:Hsp20/alpha crystallin family protein [Mucilaginibacter rivuli]MBW4890316.1 Hsp20/alpha crystallin family protein [Mucilaginibacter rivuli]